METNTQLILTEKSPNEVHLIVSHLDIRGLLDLSEFNNVAYVNCFNNTINRLSGLREGIRELNCSSNKITSFINLNTNKNVLPQSLIKLLCSKNKLNELNGLPEGLKYLDCGHNININLDNLPHNLTTLLCNGCEITKLNNLPITLKILNASKNNLTQIDYLPESITFLNINSNKHLTSLENLPNSVEKIILNDSHIILTTLPFSLKVLYCPNSVYTKLLNEPSIISKIKTHVMQGNTCKITFKKTSKNVK